MIAVNIKATVIKIDNKIKKNIAIFSFFVILSLLNKRKNIKTKGIIKTK